MKRYRIYFKFAKMYENFTGIYFESDSLDTVNTEFKNLCKICEKYFTQDLDNKTIWIRKDECGIYGTGLQACIIDSFDTSFNDPSVYDFGVKDPLCQLYLDGRLATIADDEIYIDATKVAVYDESIPTITAILNYME